MGRQKNSVFPKLQRILEELGENIRLARLRRKFSTTQLAERAAISRNTLRAVEQGSATVTFSAYANVLHCLGLENDLRLIARDDELGRKIQDAQLPTRARAPRVKISVEKKNE
jgi:transcriptional regulator with XRE-family HTH domain